MFVRMKRLMGCGLILAVGFFTASTSQAEIYVRVSPLGLAAGALNFDVNFEMNSEWTLGPTLRLARFSTTSSEDSGSHDMDVQGTELGAQAVWYKNGLFTDGLYLSPALVYRDVQATLKADDGDYVGKLAGLAAQGIVGYGWFWEQFSMQLGGGLNLPLGSRVIEVTEPNGEVTEFEYGAGLALEFMMGWRF